MLGAGYWIVLRVVLRPRCFRLSDLDPINPATHYWINIHSDAFDPLAMRMNAPSMEFPAQVMDEKWLPTSMFEFRRLL